MILEMTRYMDMPAPAKKESVPHNPKKCIGRLENFPTNVMESMSRKPLINLLHPNFDFPYLRGRCSTTFSPIFLKPAHFASTGIYRCISPYTSMPFTVRLLYAFNPQLKSCRRIPETALVMALKNFEGIFFVSVLS